MVKHLLQMILTKRPVLGGDERRDEYGVRPMSTSKMILTNSQSGLQEVGMTKEVHYLNHNLVTRLRFVKVQGLFVTLRESVSNRSCFAECVNLLQRRIRAWPSAGSD